MGCDDADLRLSPWQRGPHAAFGIVVHHRPGGNFVQGARAAFTPPTAPVDGADDEYLMASYRPGTGNPTELSPGVMVAMNNGNQDYEHT